MAGFLMVLGLVLAAELGGRGQATVAGLTLRQGRRPAVLLVALGCGIATALLAGWLAMQAQALDEPRRVVLAGAVLVLAALECIVPARLPSPREPTNSLGALALVLAVQFASDAPRLAILGLGAALVKPQVALLSGILGAGLLSCAGWMGPGLPTTSAVRQLRWLAGIALICAAGVLFLRDFSPI